MNLYRHNSTFKVSRGSVLNKISKRKQNSEVRLGSKNIKPPKLQGKRVATLRRSRLNANGRRTTDWRKVWRFLKPELERRGRTQCEFNFIPHDCWGMLTPAHSKKRRMMQGQDIYMVGIACSNVHQILDERMSHADMEQAVLRAIEANGGAILPKEKQ